jgi:hypothetical protein
MESESEEPVVMSEIRISKFKMDRPEMWLDVTFLVNSKGNFKISIKIFKA